MSFLRRPHAGRVVTLLRLANPHAHPLQWDAGLRTPRTEGMDRPCLRDSPADVKKDGGYVSLPAGSLVSEDGTGNVHVRGGDKPGVIRYTLLRANGRRRREKPPLAALFCTPGPLKERTGINNGRGPCRERAQKLAAAGRHDTRGWLGLALPGSDLIAELGLSSEKSTGMCRKRGFDNMFYRATSPPLFVQKDGDDGDGDDDDSHFNHLQELNLYVRLVLLAKNLPVAKEERGGRKEAGELREGEHGRRSHREEGGSLPP
ncbi:hypothetical protein B296_00054093 [Ensete ventricosum]|uniref:Uncharacterized protein n=1 Tax=Ensete ventricosum TaxID=4639 RepID=A0A426X544_ENSVE|nr:hypothetical protein B296_00054093 [Ensete ventricosum]